MKLQFWRRSKYFFYAVKRLQFFIRVELLLRFTVFPLSKIRPKAVAYTKRWSTSQRTEPYVNVYVYVCICIRFCIVDFTCCNCFESHSLRISSWTCVSRSQTSNGFCHVEGFRVKCSQTHFNPVVNFEEIRVFQACTCGQRFQPDASA